MIIRSIHLALFFCLFSIICNAQDSSQLKLRKNIIKLNLIGITINTQYERLLSKRIGISMGFKILPLGAIPLRGLINTDSATMRTINKLRVVHYAFTPEIRFYLGKKGYGEGFYIAPFYRNGYYEAKGVGLDFLKDNGQDDTLQFNAQIKSNTFGILLGAQWKLGKRFMLDMQFFGPHFGNSTLVITGRPRYEMTIDEQDNLEALGQFLSEEVRNNLINAGVPFKNEIIKKDPNRIQLKANSIWGGLRAGITLGWKF